MATTKLSGRPPPVPPSAPPPKSQRVSALQAARRASSWALLSPTNGKPRRRARDPADDASYAQQVVEEAKQSGGVRHLDSLSQLAVGDSSPLIRGEPAAANTFDLMPDNLKQRVTAAAALLDSDDMDRGKVRNLPSYRMHDLYYVVLSMPGWLFYPAVVATYIAVVTVFALLYYSLGAECSTAGESYRDFLAFSVQTLFTIGYGVLAPDCPRADTVVLAQSVTGVVLVAILTGLIYSRFSRPVNKIVFSDSLVITDSGEMQVRIGNTRGNQIYSASLSVVFSYVTLDSIGQPYTCSQDVALAQGFRASMTYSWTASHLIDDASPLRVLTPELVLQIKLGLSSNDMVAACVMVLFNGLDGTTLDSVFAKHSYDVSDILFGHRFKSMQVREGSSIVLDFSRLHAVASTDMCLAPDTSDEGAAGGKLSGVSELVPNLRVLGQDSADDARPRMHSSLVLPMDDSRAVSYYTDTDVVVLTEALFTNEVLQDDSPCWCPVCERASQLFIGGAKDLAGGGYRVGVIMADLEPVLGLVFPSVSYPSVAVLRPRTPGGVVKLHKGLTAIVDLFRGLYEGAGVAFSEVMAERLLRPKATTPKSATSTSPAGRVGGRGKRRGRASMALASLPPVVAEEKTSSDDDTEEHGMVCEDDVCRIPRPPQSPATAAPARNILSLPGADSVSLFVAGPGEPREVSLRGVFKSKRVVMFGVPGAFTPTCQEVHVPSFVGVLHEFAAMLFDDVVCLSVCDPFVLHAWSKAMEVPPGSIAFVSDPMAGLTRKLGLEMEVDVLGTRCKRFAMVVEDGHIRAEFVDEDPGEPGLTTGHHILEVIRQLYPHPSSIPALED